MNKDIDYVLVSEDEIRKICYDLGKQLTKDYKSNKDLLVVGLLKGCNPFMADLVRNINLKFSVDYMVASSYHGGIESSGDVKISLDLSQSVAGRDILIVEDIVDTGRTITAIKELLVYRGANSIKIVTLLDKFEGRVVECQVDYVGRTIPNVFVVGYGLDYNEYYRNLSFVGVLKKSVYGGE
jgi:hypoxanthine phosphoribosyltransferase/bifunctional protein TilS/HprT